uniref:Uncharacterized protein n=1 Tax=Arundo donax TaxID=35708 RepID=A0A0A8YVG3_ARUDO
MASPTTTCELVLPLLSPRLNSSAHSARKR